MNLTLDAALVASVFAVDPHGLGGVCLRSGPHPLRDDWIELLRDLLPPLTPLRRVPFNIVDSRLLGGLDFAATLRAGRPIVERGVLASIDGGVLIVTMAERLDAHTAGTLARVLDRGDIDVAREGVSIADAARIGIVAFDEGVSEDEFTPRCLMDRFAFLVDFSVVTARSRLQAAHDASQIASARELLSCVEVDDSSLRALCATAMTLGAGSTRVALLAVRVARVLAALDGRRNIVTADAQTAGRLVLAPRASALPAPPPAQAPPADATDTPSTTQAPPDATQAPGEESRETAEMESPQPAPQEVEERVLAATQSAIPQGLLSRLHDSQLAGRIVGAAKGRFGVSRQGGTRGRPVGITKAVAGKSRLNLVATLRAAAPWQALRGRDSREARLRILAEDLRMTRYQQRSQTLTIFAVDASGSAALNRLAEAKGAVELLLADCYIRRDQVAVIAFRGRGAEILLPPTRSLVRAKRGLAGLPGGGGTPLAAAIDAAVLLALQARRRGDSSIVVMLTDGRGNVARDGRTGRELGQADAVRAAAGFRAARLTGLFVDTSPRPQPLARELAKLMDASYVPLPYADARALSSLVGSVSQRPAANRAS